MAILTPGAIEDLIKKGKIAAGSRVNLARVGVGVVVKAGAPRPDISTVEAFKQALLAAKSVAYIDPAGGRIERHLCRRPVRQARHRRADQAEGGAHPRRRGGRAHRQGRGRDRHPPDQRNLPVKGITLVGPLPKEIQNYTTYAAGLGAGAKDSEAAKALIKALSAPANAALIKAKGMEPAGS